ncbi:MAG: hypothetical protein RBR86_02450 [Pseudobdellovibrionaceae bacterium]|jgi:hypothetical protein|nr:hypothetical protein [Pseudobdellovibrionaceae bacterium]
MTLFNDKSKPQIPYTWDKSKSGLYLVCLSVLFALSGLVSPNRFSDIASLFFIGCYVFFLLPGRHSRNIAKYTIDKDRVSVWRYAPLKLWHSSAPRVYHFALKDFICIVPFRTHSYEDRDYKGYMVQLFMDRTITEDALILDLFHVFSIEVASVFALNLADQIHIDPYVHIHPDLHEAAYDLKIVRPDLTSMFKSMNFTDKNLA